MAVIPMCYKMKCHPYKDPNQPLDKVMKHSDLQGLIRKGLEMPKWGTPHFDGISKRHQVSCSVRDILTKAATTRGIFSIHGYCSKREWHCNVGSALDTYTSKKQLRSLDSYFKKLYHGSRPYQLDTKDEHHEIGQFKMKKGLESVDSYLGEHNTDGSAENLASTYFDNGTELNAESRQPGLVQDSKTDYGQKAYVTSRLKQEGGRRGLLASQNCEEISSFYLTGVLASVNIAVFLIEIASPIRNSDMGLFSIPLLYGAKINHLILLGDWWRLVTPMFLHAGIFHISLSCWALISFGPRVCKVYGSLTFILIYILGGVAGNLTSFFHTPELTVGGTGPVFAIIGAWLIYQLQNKTMITKDVSDSMFQKAVIVTALAFSLSNFGPIDDWSHLAAALTGVAYGFLTCSTIQLDDTSARTGQKEGLSVSRHHADPCKSVLVFSVFIMLWSSLLFLVEPPLNELAFDKLLVM